MTAFDRSTPGHGPGRLRAAFDFLVDNLALPRDHPVRITELMDLLRKCTDGMPDSVCRRLGLHVGASYAQGVQRFRHRIYDDPFSGPADAGVHVVFRASDGSAHDSRDAGGPTISRYKVVGTLLVRCGGHGFHSVD
jgi:hypothetical protein